MEIIDAVNALAALAQNHRLAVFRLLVASGPDGLSAGDIANRLGLAPNTLTFHLDRLRHAALVTVQRDGRSMIYAARFDAMCTSHQIGNVAIGCLEPDGYRRLKADLANRIHQRENTIIINTTPTAWHPNGIGTDLEQLHYFNLGNGSSGS